MNTLVRWWRVRALESNNFTTRIRALEKVSSHPDRRFVSPLLDGLGDDDADVRATSAKALGEIGDPRAAQALVERLLCERERIVLDCIFPALANLGAEAVLPWLTQAMESEDAQTRFAAAAALRRLFWEHLTVNQQAQVSILNDDYLTAAELGPAALEPLREVIHHDTPRAARDAADALGQVGSPEAIALLEETVRDSSLPLETRRVAAWALKRYAWDGLSESTLACLAVINESWSDAVTVGDAAIAPLCEALNEGSTTARERAVMALVRIGTDQAIKTLCQAMLDAQQNVIIRCAAAKALGKMGATAAVDSLLNALDESVWCVREAAARALEMLQAPNPDLRRTALRLMALKDWQAVARLGQEALKPLCEAMRFYSVSQSVARTLCEMGDAGIETLVAILRDKNQDPALREVAAAALADAGDQRAIEPLVERLRDPDIVIRQSAVWMLERLGWNPRNDTEKAVVAIVREDWAWVRSLGSAAVEPLLRLAESGMARDETFAALHDVIKEKAARISIKQLKEIVALPDPEEVNATQVATATRTAQAPESAAGCVKLRQFAKFELIRRGIIN
ncbi:MAG: HEAT repeat domain-containing protein [Phycisphaerae bacterium]|nr:HEAT repeat domain-containing protein [Phycisphaerae bacterium]